MQAIQSDGGFRLRIENFPHLVLKQVFDKMNFEQLVFLSRVPGFRSVLKGFYKVEMNQKDLVFKGVKETLLMFNHSNLIVNEVDYDEVIKFAKINCPARQDLYQRFISSLTLDEIKLLNKNSPEGEFKVDVKYPTVFDVQQVYDTLGYFVDEKRKRQLKQICWYYCFRMDEEEDKEYLAYLEKVHFQGKDGFKNLMSYLEKVIEKDLDHKLKNALEKRLGWIETFVEEKE